MLSGRRAFHGETPADTLTAILRQDPPDLSGLGREIPPALERITRRCLEKDPAERFQSAQDVGFALEAVRDAGPTKPETATPLRPGRPARLAAAARAPRLAGVAVAGFVAASLLTSWLLRPRTTSKIAGSAQLTFSGAAGAPNPYSEWFQAILTDGARIYFADSSRPSTLAASAACRHGQVLRSQIAISKPQTPLPTAPA